MNCRFGSEKGMGRLGCFVSGLLLIVAIFVGSKVAPVYIDKIALEDQLLEIAVNAGANAWGDRTVTQHVLTAVREAGFRVDPKEVNAGRTSGGTKISLSVTYRKTVEFPGYAHTFQFTSEASGFVGRLK